MDIRRKIETTFFVVALCIASADPASAGVKVLVERADSERHADLLREGLDLLYDTVVARMPGLLHEMPALGLSDPKQIVCDHGHAPVTHAVLIGSNQYATEPRWNLSGAENDVRLLASTLMGFGVDPARIHALTGAEARRANIAARLSILAGSVGCGDRVFLQLAGQGYRYGTSADEASSTSFVLPFLLLPAVFRPDEPAEAALSARWAGLASMLRNPPAPDDWLGVWSAIHDAAKRFEGRTGRHPLEGSRLPDTSATMLRRWNQWGLDRFDDFLLFLHRPDDAVGATEVVLGSEIAGTAALLRARGAHVVVLADLSDSSYGRLTERSGIGEDHPLHYHYRPEQPDAEEADRSPRLPAGAGELVVMEAGVEHMPSEMPLPLLAEDQVTHGWFSFHVANSLLENPTAHPRELAEKVAEFAVFQEGRHPDFRITSTDPHLVLVPEAAPVSRDSDAIRLISPDLTRGASRIEKPQIELVAALDWPARILGVWANDEPVQVAPDGIFTRSLNLQTGLNRVVLTALTGDSRLHRRVVEFAFDGDREALAGQGRRYAVLIANQTYGGSTGFSHLQTPIGDARALAALLRRRFGFVTEFSRDGNVVPLVLEDQTQRQILRTLNALAGVVGPQDTVLVFYAGHGVSDQNLGKAAWAVADTEQGFPDSLLHSSTLENALLRFRAGNLILISDSCYAGALFRSGDETVDTPSEEARIEWLLRAQERVSRVLITSGNDQPVLDGGGDGHSVFARSLLRGLADMPEEAFTASELFQRYLLHPVAGRTDQEPQYRTLRDLGHVGGDVVFVTNMRED